MIEHNFYVGDYSRCGEVAVLRVLGIRVYMKVGNVYSLMGMVFEL